MALKQEAQYYGTITPTQIAVLMANLGVMPAAAGVGSLCLLIRRMEMLPGLSLYKISGDLLLFWGGRFFHALNF